MSATHLLLTINTLDLARLWDHSPLYTLISTASQAAAAADLVRSKLLRQLSELACASLALMLGLSEQARLSLDMAIRTAFSEPDSPKPGSLLPSARQDQRSIEQALMFVAAGAPAGDVSSQLQLRSNSFVPQLVDVCGVLLPSHSRRPRAATASGNVPRTASVARRFSFTETSANNLRSLALAVCQQKPILLQGVTGSGKTSLVEELAALSGHAFVASNGTIQSDLVRLHLGDQADAKVLLGTYVCTVCCGFPAVSFL
jgi:hypothetical protein